MKLFNLFNSTKQVDDTSKSHIKNLFEMAIADGQFAEIENDLLNAIAKRNGINEKTLVEIKKRPESVKSEIPQSNRERFLQFYDLVHMMKIDNFIHVEEMKLCNKFALEFGYHKDNVEILIDSVLSCIDHKKSPDETMGRVIRLIA